MSRGTVPILSCDTEDDICDEWTLDDYGMDVHSVDGVRITTTERSPGWTSTGDADFCPEHKRGARMSDPGIAALGIAAAAAVPQTLTLAADRVATAARPVIIDSIQITDPPRAEPHHVHRWAYLTGGGQACGVCGAPR